MNENKLMRQIMEFDFAEYELMLYLDTHPNDTRAIKLHKKVSDKAKELKAVYEEKYGPITANASNSTESWNWINSPWPWDN